MCARTRLRVGVIVKTLFERRHRRRGRGHIEIGKAEDAHEGCGGRLRNLRKPAIRGGVEHEIVEKKEEDRLA